MPPSRLPAPVSELPQRIDLAIIAALRAQLLALDEIVPLAVAEQLAAAMVALTRARDACPEAPALEVAEFRRDDERGHGGSAPADDPGRTLAADAVRALEAQHGLAVQVDPDVPF